MAATTCIPLTPATRWWEKLFK